jgi:hypothetical protein
MSSVQKANNSTTMAYASNATSLTVTFSAQATVAGNRFMAGASVYIDSGTAPTPTFSDNGATPATWTVDKNQQWTSANMRVCLAHSTAIVAGKSSHTVSISITTSELALFAIEVSNIASSPTATVNGGASASGTAVSTGAVSPSGTNQYIALQSISDSATFTDSWSGSTRLCNGTYDCANTKNSTGSQTGTWTNGTSRGWCAAILALDEVVNLNINVADCTQQLGQIGG